MITFVFGLVLGALLGGYGAILARRLLVGAVDLLAAETQAQRFIASRRMLLSPFWPYFLFTAVAEKINAVLKERGPNT